MICTVFSTTIKRHEFDDYIVQIVQQILRLKQIKFQSTENLMVCLKTLKQIRFLQQSNLIDRVGLLDYVILNLYEAYDKSCDVL